RGERLRRQPVAADPELAQRAPRCGHEEAADQRVGDVVPGAPGRQRLGGIEDHDPHRCAPAGEDRQGDGGGAAGGRPMPKGGGGGGRPAEAAGGGSGPLSARAPDAHGPVPSVAGTPFRRGVLSGTPGFPPPAFAGLAGCCASSEWFGRTPPWQPWRPARCVAVERRPPSSDMTGGSAYAWWQGRTTPGRAAWPGPSWPLPSVSTWAPSAPAAR